VYLSLAGIVQSSDVSIPSEDFANSIDSNFLGLVLIAKLLGSLAAITLFNFALFVWGLRCAASLPGVRLGAFFFLLILNPTTTPALLTLNKEIFTFISVVLLVKYISATKRSKLDLFVLLLVSIIPRWEQFFVVALFLLFEAKHSFLKDKHKIALLLMTSAITIGYPLLLKANVLGLATENLLLSGQMMPKLNEIQAAYGFPLVVIPKALLNLFGELLRPSFFWTDYLKGDFNDIQNSFVYPLHCLCMFIVCMAAMLRGKLDLNDKSIYWASMYIIVSAVAPIMEPRYQFPIYVLLCLEVSGLRSPRVSARARMPDARVPTRHAFRVLSARG
jgi:hypothetical protein